MIGDSLLLINARIVGEDKILDPGWMHVTEGVIGELGHGAPPNELFSGLAYHQVDARGQWVVPGFIDMHVHGANGADVMDGTSSAIEKIGQFHIQHGTTGWLPTTLTAPIEALEKSIQASGIAQQTAWRSGSAQVLGVHLEGPFLSPSKMGAQNPVFVQPPNISIMKRLLETVPGLVRKVTLAPEQPGALQLIQFLREEKVIVSIGHTVASYEETIKAFEAGATHATHVFNAMNSIHHREPGAVGACLLSQNVICELIADGHHVHPEVLKLVMRLKGKDGVILITDAIGATGKPDGVYQLGGMNIVVKQGISTLQDSQSLAGSTLTMDEAIRNMMIQVGVTLFEAIQMASLTPARELGLDHRKGVLAVGHDADFVLLDESLLASETYILGRRLYRRS
ncbi:MULTISPECIES: N-acetylglucosamine-6-phosphate deacetylase [Alicyclobacillus]|uniref:N-acetylglucosamine-6-phosphate deacetylase n=2 Tax=Alicyclobacillus tolerans TaxID=90970 RepID=A0ABT9LSL9_9BACL|nr:MULTISPECIES: N-acetylglucosamine-6-phosphate deacetylase [Alicyclobacillus]MDP9727191.1 N-acetylglucosamine-6-phosphate deacetylase [Alicyclobacillus tengchongensis]SHK45280.1 N-acetylglucosamine-6-phosphate deacetylase [Alicyclobacillus montanus]